MSLRNRENRLVRRAIQNIQRARERYVLLINPDSVIHGNAIQKMADYLGRHPEVGAVGPRVLRPDGSVRNSLSRFLTFKWGFYEVSGINTVRPENQENRSVMPAEVWYDPDVIQEAEVLYGACILTRRDVLEAVGGMDEMLVHGWDEYDWCQRARERGFLLRYLPCASITHVEGASRKAPGMEAVAMKHGYDGMFYFYQKHCGRGAVRLLSFAARRLRPLVLKYGRPAARP